MIDISRLAALLDDPQVRVVVFGLAHAGSSTTYGQAGAPRIHAVMINLADTVQPAQYRNWLSEDQPNRTMTVDQVRAAIGEDRIDDIARYADTPTTELAWQLAALLPDLVDALSPSGYIIDADHIAQYLRDATTEDDRTTGSFGPQVH